MNLVYDVAHNIAKMEQHTVDGTQMSRLRPPQGRDAGLPARPPGRARPGTARSASR